MLHFYINFRFDFFVHVIFYKFESLYIHTKRNKKKVDEEEGELHEDEIIFITLHYTSAPFIYHTVFRRFSIHFLVG